MLSATVGEALNAHINAELASAYLYRSMSLYCRHKNLRGFAHWLTVQSHEENRHADRIVEYVVDRGGRAVLRTLDAPPEEFGGMTELFDRVLKHERQVTSLVQRLYEVATKEKDTGTQVFLQWFVTEQVEEEARASEMLGRLQLVGEQSSGVLFLDKEAGKRSEG